MATYYVDTNSSGGDGTTQATSGANAAWATVASVNGASFSAGDSVLFKKGCTWRDATLTLPSSGSSGSTVTLGAYGTGANPIINGADVLSAEWTQVTSGGASADIFFANFSGNAFDGHSYSKGLAGTGEYVAMTGAGAGIAAAGGIVTVTVDAVNETPARYFTAEATKTEVWVEYDIKYTAITANNAQYIQGLGPKNSAGTVKLCQLGMRETGGVDYFLLTYNPDAGQVQQDLATAIVINQTYRVLIHWKRATAAGANDGILQVWIDGSKDYEATNIDNDTHNFQIFQLGNNYRDTATATFTVDNLKIGTAGTGIGAAASSNVWSTAFATEKYVLIFNGSQYGYRWPGRYYLSSDYTWMWENGVLYVYGTESPATYYDSIENSSRAYGIDTNGQTYITIQDIDFKNANTDNILINAGNNVTVQRCGTSNAGVRNIYASGDTQSYITVDSCTSARAGSRGITATGAEDGEAKTNFTVSNNTSLRDGIISHLYEAPTGTTFQWTGGLLFYGILTSNIYGNQVTYAGVRDDNASAGVTQFTASNHGFGLWLDSVKSTGAANQVRVYRNSVSNNAQSGLFCEKSAFSLWDYNLSFNNTEYGLRIDCDAGTAVPAVHDNAFYNNTLYGNAIGINTQGGYDLVEDSNYNNLFKNNISSGNTTAEFRARYGGENDGTNGSGNVYTYNCLGAEASNFISWGGANKSTYDAWETAYGGTTSSVEADPLFVNAAGGDFRLQATSPARNAGVPVGLTNDYDGNTIKEGIPDIGAYEYQAAPLRRWNIPLGP